MRPWALEVLDRAPADEPAPTSVDERLAALTTAGQLVRAADGYRLAAG